MALNVSPATRPGARSRGGRFAWQGVQEVLRIHGHRVTLGARQDGTWAAHTPDPSKVSKRRAWNGQSREALVDRITADLAPTEDAPLAVVTEAHAGVLGGDAPPHSFHVVGVRPADYPLAAALDALTLVVVPALDALEAAGKSDAAALLRAETEMTPLESELVALYRRVMRGE